MTGINNLEKQNLLIKRIQKSFPIHAEPFSVLAEELDLKEKEILDQLIEWKEQKFLREISAVMEGSLLDYDSALVCGKVPADRLAEVAQIIGEHPTVTHLYERNHYYNLWFTIAVPFSMGLENHLSILERLTQIEKYYPLRRIDTFKIGVVFDLQTLSNDTSRIDLSFCEEKLNPNETAKRIIRAIQKPLPLTLKPFEALALENGIAEKEILEFMQTNVGKSVRKYIATLRHRNIGVNYNAMTVWSVKEDLLQQKGKDLSVFPQVSHCYSRNKVESFDYNLYSMIHGPDEITVHGYIKEISSTLNLKDYLILHSPTEFKKCRLRYFLKELEEWNDKAGLILT